MRDEDIIATILTPQELVRCYRFYGARHSSVLAGYKIDFELVSNAKFIPQLRSVIHLGFGWLIDRSRLGIWQQFMRLLYTHLKDVDSLESVYFDQLELCARRMGRQNPKRLLIETYTRILEYEGRLHSDFECFLCELPCGDEVALARAFLPAHPECLSSFGFKKDELARLFLTHSSAHLEDFEIDRLYFIMCEGL